MRVYLASSWKNAPLVKDIKTALSAYGHEVDAFCDDYSRDFVFGYNELPDISKHNAMTVPNFPVVQLAFHENKKWLDWSDAVLLILPSGKSAHLEAGYAVGSGKKLVIYQQDYPQGEFDVMYGFADLITDDLTEVIDYFNQTSERMKARKPWKKETAWVVRNEQGVAIRISEKPPFEE